MPTQSAPQLSCWAGPPPSSLWRVPSDPATGRPNKRERERERNFNRTFVLGVVNIGSRLWLLQRRMPPKAICSSQIHVQEKKAPTKKESEERCKNVKKVQMRKSSNSPDMCHCEGNKVPRVVINIKINLEAAFGDIQDLAYGAQQMQ